MKKLNTLSKITLLFLCTLSMLTAQAQWNSIRGSKEVVTKDRSISSFSSIEAGGSVNIYLRQGNNAGVSVEADDNLHEYIITEVKGDRLKIYSEKNFRNYKALNIFVTFTNLEAIKAGGATDVYLESEVNAKKFTLEVGGSADFEADEAIISEVFISTVGGAADVEVEVITKELDIKAGGSSDFAIKGSTEKMILDLSGSSDFEASDFVAKSCDASLSGSSDGYVNVTETLSATASGSSDLYYRGNPSIQKIRTSGSADINRQ